MVVGPARNSSKLEPLTGNEALLVGKPPESTFYAKVVPSKGRWSQYGDVSTKMASACV